MIVCGTSGERTSPEGLAQLQAWVEAEGWEFRSYCFDPYFLHLDVKLAMLSDKLAAVCGQALEQEFLDWLEGRGIELIDISYRAMLKLGCNVVALGNDRVLMPNDNVELREKCRARGLEVIAPRCQPVHSRRWWRALHVPAPAAGPCLSSPPVSHTTISELLVRLNSSPFRKLLGCLGTTSSSWTDRHLKPRRQIVISFSNGRGSGPDCGMLPLWKLLLL